MKESDVYNKVLAAIQPYKSEVSIRNQYIRTRDEYIYGEALIKGIIQNEPIDITKYNWVRRAVDIHTSGLMGRGFRVTSTYDKRDLSIAKDIDDEQQLTNDHLFNKTLKANAEGRASLIDEIIRSNGGDDLWLSGAESGSAYGFTVYKSWPDTENKEWKLENLESIENFYALWSSSNFRERDADVYVHQISPTAAYQEYGQYLDDGEEFATTKWGDPFGDGGTITTEQNSSDMDMVTVLEYTGILSGVAGSKTMQKKYREMSDLDEDEAKRRYPDPEDFLQEVDRGEETPINLLFVGGIPVRTLTDEDVLPSYYIIQNTKRPKRPWGWADVTDEAIDINKTVVERMSNWNTVLDRVGFPKYLGRGFAGTSVPRPTPRRVEVLPLSENQNMDLLQAPDYGLDFNQMKEALKEEFVREVKISRVLFDDPDIAANSNQALTTTMKGMTDTVEKKQKRWAVQLTEMFDDALRRAGKLWKEVGDVVDADDSWHLSIKWPSVMRKDDSVYQQNIINRFNTGTMSLDTFLEESGVDNPGEEVDRLRDNYQDPLIAAIMARQTAMIAQQMLMPPQPEGPPAPDVKVSLRGNLTPNQEANIATQQGYNDGPFPPSAGPQGNEGDAANVNNLNKDGFIDGDQNKAGFGNQLGPDGQPVSNQPGQVTTPDANQGGTGIMSQPGSGATPVSAQGAINQANQQAGQ